MFKLKNMIDLEKEPFITVIEEEYENVVADKCQDIPLTKFNIYKLKVYNFLNLLVMLETNIPFNIQEKHPIKKLKEISEKTSRLGTAYDIRLNFEVHYTIDDPRLIFCNDNYTKILVQVSDIHISQRLSDTQTQGVKHYFNGN